MIKCPRTGCTFSTSDADAVVAAAILNGHTAEHTSTNATGAGGAKPPPVERPKLQLQVQRLIGWCLVFKSRWNTFKAAVNVSESKAVHQLLGCLESDLLKSKFHNFEDSIGDNV